MSTAGALRRTRTAVLAVGLPWIAINIALRIPVREIAAAWRDRMFLGGTLLMVVGLLAMIAFIPVRSRLARHRRVGLAVDPAGPTFVVLPSPVFVAFWGVVGSVVLANSGATLVVSLGWGRYGLGFPLIGVVVVGLTALISWYLVFRSPDLRLTPSELVVRKPYGNYMAPWDALDAGGPRPPGAKAHQLVVHVRRPELVRSAGLTRRRPSWFAIELPGLAVDPSFLANVIRSYVEHPSCRSGIGTAAEHERLMALFGSAALSGVDRR